jgi:hypothetical protein
MYYRSNWNKLLMVMRKHSGIFTGGIAKKEQRGAIAPLAAIMLVPIMGFAALAIDIGHMMVVRNQLQNAADSAALATAQYMQRNNYVTFTAPYTYTTWTSTTLQANPTVQAAVSGYVSKNISDNIVLTIDPAQTSQFDVGYWDFSKSTASFSHSPGANIPPAVKIVINRNSTVNGAVHTFFAGVIGIPSFNMSATAVAVIPPGPSYTKKNLFPFAISGCIFQNGPPTGTFISDSPYGPSSSNCYTGQWTPLSTSKNESDSYVSDLISKAAAGGTSSSSLSIGQSLYMQSGTQANLYQDTNSCSDIGVQKNGKLTPKSCAYQLMPVVCPSPTTGPSCSGSGDLTNNTQTIVDFVCVHILSAEPTGSNKSITMEVVPKTDPNYLVHCMMSDSGGVGPAYGASTPPGLVNYFNNNY